MVGYMLSSFVDLVCAGERIEVGLKRGKFDYATPMTSGNRRANTNGGRKKEGEAHALVAASVQPDFA